VQVTRQPLAECLPDIEASFDGSMANGAPHFLHTKPIHDSDRCSVAISLAHPAASGLSKRSTILSMLDEVIRRVRFHRWRHAERLTPARDVALHKVYGHVAP
jgi:hypothetical protein